MNDLFEEIEVRESHKKKMLTAEQKDSERKASDEECTKRAISDGLLQWFFFRWYFIPDKTKSLSTLLKIQKIAQLPHLIKLLIEINKKHKKTENTYLPHHTITFTKNPNLFLKSLSAPPKIHIQHTNFQDPPNENQLVWLDENVRL